MYKLAKDAVPKRTMRNYLDLLRELYFPYEGGGSSPKHRVSLFLPTNWPRRGFIRYPSVNKHLALYARSGLPEKSAVSWRMPSSRRRQFDGIVGWVYANGVRFDSDDKGGLPDYDKGTKQEQETYRRKTFVDKRKVKRLNIKSRSYKAFLVQNRSSEKVGVLVIESEEPNGLTEITRAKLDEIAKTIQCLFIS